MFKHKSPNTVSRLRGSRLVRNTRVLWSFFVIAMLLLLNVAVGNHTALADAQPGAATASNANPLTSDATASKKQVLGYYTEWAAADDNYLVKNLVSSGTAAKATMILYAFSNVANGQCAIGDAQADYGKAYTAANSVSGTADSKASGALRGNFHQLQELKALYPNLKVVISIGGWSWSNHFSNVAMTDASRKAFVTSCINMFIKGTFAKGLTYPGLFDGIDIDWEYPGTCGNTCNYNAKDPQNYVKLLAEFRSQLNTLSQSTGATYSIHVATPSGYEDYKLLQLSAMSAYLDTIDLMAYDIHGSWEDVTNFNAPLYASPDDPSHDQKSNVDYAVQAYLAAGVPASKLVLGVPFYGNGWTKVPNRNNGLYQTSTTPAPGTDEDGVENYNVLKTLVGHGYTQYRDSASKAMWIFNGKTFWSYDDPTTLATKMSYVKSNSLGGVMFWDASGDDAQGSLISAIYNGLH